MLSTFAAFPNLLGSQMLSFLSFHNTAQISYTHLTYIVIYR
jgi:hypothetical protein